MRVLNVVDEVAGIIAEHLPVHGEVEADVGDDTEHGGHPPLVQRADALILGPGRCRSPHHRMPRDSKNVGTTCVG